ncbi:hypothetical protein H8356DRAFT_1678053 [Neocallimastix lanati (nom. inval.)]|nr:hypothetical protein H8356DRAFT_1678053 [Neocallimastix sp. JGI-2020a]
MYNFCLYFLLLLFNIINIFECFCSILILILILCYNLIFNMICFLFFFECNHLFSIIIQYKGKKN